MLERLRREPLAGAVNPDGTVSIWAVTSTASGGGDQSADPNKLAEITDELSATSLPADESFQTVRTAVFGGVYRGVSFTPGSHSRRCLTNWRSACHCLPSNACHYLRS